MTLATQKENARYASLCASIENKAADAEVAHYEMAKLVMEVKGDAYSPLQFDIKKPCFELDDENLQGVVNGMRKLTYIIEQRHVEKESSDHHEVACAIDFLRFVREVTDRESENASRACAMLYALETFESSNPQGDMPSIAALREDLRDWYGIQDCPTGRTDRNKLADRKTRRYDLLPIRWRVAWEKMR